MLRTPGSMSSGGKQKLRSFMGSNQAAQPGKLTVKPLQQRMRTSSTPGHRQPKVQSPKPALPKVTKPAGGGMMKDMGRMMAFNEAGSFLGNMGANQLGEGVSTLGFMGGFGGMGGRRKAAAFIAKIAALGSGPESFGAGDTGTNPVQLLMDNAAVSQYQDNLQEKPAEHNPNSAEAPESGGAERVPDSGMHGKLKDSVISHMNAISA